METARSADGTALAYEVEGQGPPLVVVTGAFNDRKTTADLAALLAADFTVLRYDRRGRGDSGDAPAYAVEREVEDLAAIIDAAGGGAFAYGHSSGAALALLTAASGVPITKLVAYEPPYRVDGGGDPGLADRLWADVAAGDRVGAVKRFLAEAIGVPPEAVAVAEHWPDWPGMLAIAHTLPYDLTLVGDGSVPSSLAAVAVPTLVLHGDRSFDWIVDGMAELVRTIPSAIGRVMIDQDHGVAPEVIGPELRAFFLGA
jgi:pimeloyl-ACP methyl ester carboxylesterase